MKQYDESKFRVLGIGERVVPGDSLLPVQRDGYTPGRPHLIEPSSILDGHVVTDDIDLLFLRPITDTPAPAPAAPSRKDYPVASGVLDYFPDALRAIAQCSKLGNDQHNPGKALHWDRSKSGDESDALIRHFLERGTNDTDGVRHTTKVAWRALALLQKELESAK